MQIVVELVVAGRMGCGWGGVGVGGGLGGGRVGGGASGGVVGVVVEQR